MSEESGEGESRANRLRNRRQRTRDRAADQDKAAEEETDETDKLDKTDKPPQTSKQSQTYKLKDGAEARSSVKDEQVGTYMYLPESLTEELAYQFKIQSAEYEREIGTAIEKNRHWYPLLLSLGLEQVKEMDPEEMQSRLAPEGGE